MEKMNHSIENSNETLEKRADITPQQIAAEISLINIQIELLRTKIEQNSDFEEMWNLLIDELEEERKMWEVREMGQKLVKQLEGKTPEERRQVLKAYFQKQEQEKALRSSVEGRALRKVVVDTLRSLPPEEHIEFLRSIMEKVKVDRKKDEQEETTEE